MLQTLRDKTSGWFATVVLGLLVIPFAFVGVQDYLRQTREMPVASISAPPTWWPSAPSFWPVSALWQHQDVTQQEFRDAFERERQDARQRDGAKFDSREFESVGSKRKVLDRLIDQRVQTLWATRHDIAVSDAMVRQTIAAIPQFQVNGKFDLQQYRIALRTMISPPKTEAQYEQLVREGLTQSLMPTTVYGSAFSTPSETERLVALLGEKRDLSAVEVPAPPADTAPVSASEIDAWYRAHSNLYRAPETVTLEYVDLDASTLPAPTIDEAALRQRYEQEKARFVAAEQRQASHILIAVPAGADAAADKAAREKATQLAAQARAGGDFAALARANSDDTGSKAAGGDLGFVGRGALAPAFEKTLFAMQPGQISDPVRTEFGWHVIQLRQVEQGRQEAFEQARATLEAEVLQTERERRYNELTSKLVDAVLKNPSSLGPAARSLGLTVQTAGPLARGQGAGVLAEPRVQRTAFSESAIAQGMVSDPIDVGTNHSVVLRVTSHAAARQLTLAEVRDRVVAAIHADRVMKAAKARVDAIVAQVRGGQSLAQVAAAQSLAPPRPLVGVPRGAEVVAPGVSDAFFSAHAPKGKPGVGAKVLADGRALVFVVDAVHPGTIAEMGGDASALSKQLAQIKGDVDVSALIRSVRRGYKVDVREENL